VDLMSSRRFHVYVEKDSVTGLFAARCLELSVFSQGKTKQQALKNIREAISLHLDAETADPKPMTVRSGRAKWGRESFVDAGQATFGH